MQQQDNHEYPFLYQRQTCHQVQPNQATYQKRQKCQPATYLQEVLYRSEERFSRNAETDLVCRLLLEKKKKKRARLKPQCVKDKRNLEASAQAVQTSSDHINPQARSAIHGDSACTP